MNWFHSYRAATFRRTLSSVFVFACLLGTVGHAGLILCVGECGGTQIESAWEGCCANPEAESLASRPTSLLPLPTSASTDDCGACVDIPLSSPSLNSPPTSRPFQPDAQAFAVVALLPHAAPEVNAKAILQLRRASDSTCGTVASTLRSTILLI
jgi:hypothetical protein